MRCEMALRSVFPLWDLSSNELLSKTVAQLTLLANFCKNLSTVLNRELIRDSTNDGFHVPNERGQPNAQVEAASLLR